MYKCHEVFKYSWSNRRVFMYILVLASRSRGEIHDKRDVRTTQISAVQCFLTNATEKGPPKRRHSVDKSLSERQ